MKKRRWGIVVACCIIVSMLFNNVHARQAEYEIENEMPYAVVQIAQERFNVIEASFNELVTSQLYWNVFLDENGFIGLTSVDAKNIKIDSMLYELLSMDIYNYAPMDVTTYWDLPCTNGGGHFWVSRGMVTIHSETNDHGWILSFHYMWCVHCGGRYFQESIEFNDNITQVLLDDNLTFSQSQCRPNCFLVTIGPFRGPSLGSTPVACAHGYMHKYEQCARCGAVWFHSVVGTWADWHTWTNVTRQHVNHGSVHPGNCELVTERWESCSSCRQNRNVQVTRTTFWCLSPGFQPQSEPGYYDCK